MTEEELILTSVLDCDRISLYTRPRSLTPAQEEYLKEIRERRAQGEPLQYILGFCEFMGFEFFVDRRVLIPRPETEFLVEEAVAACRMIKFQAPLSILDLGTGSGNIAVSLAKLVPGSRVMAVDVSAGALEVTRGNAHLNEVTDRIECVLADMNEFFAQDARQKFHIIVSNPPYIPSAAIGTLPPEVQNEPRLALDGGKDGLDFYRVIIQAAPRFLKESGQLLMEIGADQRTSLEKICSEAPGFDRIEFKKDLCGRDRILTASKCKT